MMWGLGFRRVLFRTNSSTGAVHLTANPDYETKSSYSFEVTATDAAGNHTTQTVGLAITNVDEVAPSFSSRTTATAIAENSGANQVVYTAAATDTDFNAPATANSVTYSFGGGTDDGLFTINSSTGAVHLTANPDFVFKSCCSLREPPSYPARRSSALTVGLAITNV